MVSIAAAVISCVFAYQDSINYQRSTNPLEYMVIVWGAFSAVQLSLLIFGCVVNKLCVKDLSQRQLWVVCTKNKFLLAINCFVGFIFTVPVLLQYSYDYCQSDVVIVEWYECFAQTSFMFLIFSWFAFGFVFCIYAEIICCYLYKYIHQRFL